MKPFVVTLMLSLAVAVSAQTPAPSPGVATVDLSGWRASAESDVRTEAGRLLHLTWPLSAAERGELVFNLTDGRPLLERLAIVTAGAAAGGETRATLMQRVDPVTMLR